MVVWHSPCESSTPPGSQFNKTAPLERAGAFLLAVIWWCTARAGRPHATKTSGTFLDSFSWPRSGEPQGWGEQCSTPPNPTPATAPAGCGIVQTIPGLHRFATCLRQSKNAPGVFVAMLFSSSEIVTRFFGAMLYRSDSQPPPFVKRGTRWDLFSCYLC